jgi:hypothetical protein
MTLQPADVGIDYSGARPDHADVVANGGRFVIRYSAGAGNTSPKTQWKLCEVNELRRATEAGLDVIANSEWYESRITEGGQAGAADGAADLVFWRSRGLAAGASIYVSWDQAPDRSKWQSVAEYLRAYDRALAGQYHVDCYAGTPVLAWLKGRGVIRYGWRPNAGSWSNDGLPYQPDHHGRGLLGKALAATPAHLWQTGNYWYGKDADENLVLRAPVGSHLDAGRTVRFASPAAGGGQAQSGSGQLPTYVVAAGDTLIKIAARFPSPSITWQSIARLNHLPNPDLLLVGQVLKIG